MPNFEQSRIIRAVRAILEGFDGDMGLFKCDLAEPAKLGVNLAQRDVVGLMLGRLDALAVCVKVFASGSAVDLLLCLRQLKIHFEYLQKELDPPFAADKSPPKAVPRWNHHDVRRLEAVIGNCNSGLEDLRKLCDQLDPQEPSVTGDSLVIQTHNARVPADEKWVTLQQVAKLMKKSTGQTWRILKSLQQKRIRVGRRYVYGWKDVYQVLREHYPNQMLPNDPDQ